MKNRIYLALTVILTSLFLTNSFSKVQAEEMSQEQSGTVTCTGSYGQDCEVTYKQTQKLVDGRWVTVHMLAPTGLDVNSTAALIGVITLGVAAFFFKLSSRKA